MNITLKQAEEYIAELRPFISGNLIGQWEGTGETGSFAEPWYTVRSYNTPIAWAVRTTYGLNAHLAGDAYEHSSTTSKHANVVKNTWLAEGYKVTARHLKTGERVTYEPALVS
jgi:hypothetical protein